MPTSRSFKLLAALFWLAIWNGVVSAQPQATSESTDDWKAQVDQYLDDQRKTHNIPALSIAIFDGDSMDYVYGRGKQNDQHLANEKSIFHSASISKLFTATAIMQLVEEGKLSLDEPVQKYFPKLSSSDITIGHLMTHQAGFKNRIRPTGRLERSTLDAYILKAIKSKPAYTPGQGWAYNDTDYNLLGAIISKVSGVGFDRFVQERILMPLKMNKSSFYLPDISPDFVAAPHRGKSAKMSTKHPYDVNFAPSSGLQTNATELALFVQAHLTRDPRLLSEDSFAKMQITYSETKWDGISQGLGWQVLRGKDGETVLQHGGSDPGYRALVVAYPDDKSGYVILSNGEKTPRWQIAGYLRQLHRKAKRQR